MAQTVVVECICCMASGFDDQALLICKGSKKCIKSFQVIWEASLPV